MPYIKDYQRDLLDRHSRTLLQLAQGDVLDEGNINYLITKLLHAWISAHPNYVRYNAALGILEAAKLELYRRKIAPYEDEKIKENGDV